MIKKYLPVIIAVFLCCTACKDDDDGPNDVITNLGVNFAPYNGATQKAGDFKFEASDDKVFIEFGDDRIFPGNVIKNNPAFEYHLDKNAEVIAIANGEVARVDFRDDSNDYTAEVRSNGFIVYYDHFLNPTIEPGDVINAGHVLGNPGNWSVTLGRFEVQINDADEDLSYCIFQFFDENLKANYQQKVITLMNDWETFKGDNTIYDQGSFADAGCATLTTDP